LAGAAPAKLGRLPAVPAIFIPGIFMSIKEAVPACEAARSAAFFASWASIQVKMATKPSTATSSPSSIETTA
jgi:hypothetical protein